MTSAPPRILMIVSKYPPLPSAGMERGCQRLAQALARRGCRVGILTLASPGLPAERVEDHGVEVFRALHPPALGPLWGLVYMAHVRGWLLRRGRDWDLLLCHQLYLHSAAASGPCRKLGLPWASLLVLAGPDNDAEQLRRHRMGGLLLDRALRSDALFVLSSRAADDVAALGFPADRTWRYAYFVDSERYRPGDQCDPMELLSVGRFHPTKNLPVLVRAFERAAANLPSARLRLVGDGPSAGEARRLASRSAVGSRILVEDWTPDPSAAMRRAAAVVTATRAEGLSNVLVEALMCGTPVVTPDVSGVRDALDPDGVLPDPLPPGRFQRGCGGLVVPVDDETALAEAMGAVLANPALRGELAMQARARALEAFSEEASVPSFLEAVERIRAGAAATPQERGFPPVTRTES